MSTASTNPNSFHHALLRPAILHILRAQGFHSARPSVVDTLADLAARYLLKLGSRTAAHAQLNHWEAIPDIVDVRAARHDCAALVPSLTGSEEVWKEALRKPLHLYSERERAREEHRRYLEDTEDVRAFIDWVTGKENAEIRRIAGLLPDAPEKTGTGAVAEAEEKVDYLTALKKKHSKTGEESRFQGTVLGIPAEDRPVKIEGGPAASLQEWAEKLRQSYAQAAADQAADEEMAKAIAETHDVVMAEGSESELSSHSTATMVGD